MNGVFLHDLVRDGMLLHPVEYGRRYYSRLPALSIPYHPPLFPAVEALFFSVFGVNLFAARLAVAVSVAACVLLLYRLVVATHESSAIAFASTATFFTLTCSLWVANDVMLEFPSLVFTLLAIHCLRNFRHGFRPRMGLWFAVFAGAAVWTKQNAVFLGAVPFLYAIRIGRWEEFRRKTLWLSTAVVGMLAATLLALGRILHWSGANAGWPQSNVWDRLAHNTAFYAEAAWARLGPIPAVLIALAAAALVLLEFATDKKPAWRSGNSLYVAWAAAAVAPLLVLPAYDYRYLLYVQAPLIVVAYSLLLRLGTLVGAGRRAYALPVVTACAWALVQLRAPATWIKGPTEAVDEIFRAGAPRRVMYCGESNGSFIFAVRCRSKGSGTAVIRGDKLSDSTFTPEAMEQFARRYGVEFIVLERSSRVTWPWHRLRATPAPSMVLEREIDLSSSHATLNGDLRVYRFLNPSPQPEKSLTLRNDILGQDVRVSY